MFFELCRLAIVLAAVAVFAYIAWVDCRTMEIPDKCHLILLVLACLQIVCGGLLPLGTRGLGLVVMSLPMICTNLVREDSFGGGDIKMCGAAGFLLGGPQTIAGTLLALMLAGMFGGAALLLKIKKPKDTFALGPFLSIGYVTVLLGGLMNHGL